MSSEKTIIEIIERFVSTLLFIAIAAGILILSILIYNLNYGNKENKWPVVTERKVIPGLVRNGESILR